MTKHFLAVRIVLLVATLVAQKSAALATLPGNLQDDRASIQQDEQLLRHVARRFQIDAAAGNSVAVDADRTALRIAQIQISKDVDNLRQDADSILKADVAALTVALWQLRADQIARKLAGIAASQDSVAAAERQLLHDRELIFGSLSESNRRGHWSSEGAVSPDYLSRPGPGDVCSLYGPAASFGPW